MKLLFVVVQEDGLRVRGLCSAHCGIAKIYRLTLVFSLRLYTYYVPACTYITGHTFFCGVHDDGGHLLDDEHAFASERLRRRYMPISGNPMLTSASTYLLHPRAEPGNPNQSPGLRHSAPAPSPSPTFHTKSHIFVNLFLLALPSSFVLWPETNMLALLPFAIVTESPTRPASRSLRRASMLTRSCSTRTRRRLEWSPPPAWTLRMRTYVFYAAFRRRGRRC